MNYYERYCGDYARDTAHLVLAEHGAYTLMLDTYYSTEQPLPSDYAVLYRLCRAISKPEQATVRKVADEFFPIGQDGLRHNERADSEIGKAQKRINAVRANGAKGGRPHKPNGNLLGFPQEPGSPPGSPPGSQPGSPHMVKPPDPRPQTPKVKTTPRRVEPDGFVRFWASYPATRRRVAKVKCHDVWVAQGLESSAETIVSHIVAMKATSQWRDGYEPAPLTYLHQRRWEDGLPDGAPNAYGKVY